MNEVNRTKLEHAASAGADEIIALLHDPSPHVIKALLGNSNLTENDILVIVNRRNLPSEILAAIARDHRWSESYPIRRTLATNPKTPLSVSLSIARFLRLFDLADISLSPHIPLAFRNKVEFMISERIPSMALGMKKSLAKMAAGNVLLRLLQDPDKEVIALCLDNPRLLESHLYKIISRRDTIKGTVVMIGQHPKWSIRSAVRFALARNELTPLALAERFLHSMKLLELRDLYADPSLPSAVKPLIHRELLARGEEPRKIKEEAVYEIGESDDMELENYHDNGNEES